MVINRRDMKRRHKGDNNTCSLLDESPKRTKVHAQRKFAQGSNVSSPMITPVKDIEKQDKLKSDVLSEPQDLLPANRPHTEDFLTFLCFRGTSMLPPTLNFFNVAPADTRTHSKATEEDPNDSCPPIANINLKSVTGANERPFIAFGVRKRADPVLVSKHMDKKRRHALALQALRRKYQEQKMAKIRAVTISKLSEKVSSKNNLVRTRSVTKTESAVKKHIPAKTKVKIVSTKHVKLATRSSINSTLRQAIKNPIRRHIPKKKMCLRSYRGKFIQHELQLKKSKKPKIANRKQSKESSSDFSSDDDQPLLNTVKVKSSKVTVSKKHKKSVVNPKKPAELNYRITRASSLFAPKLDQTVKRKIQISRSSIITKSPFVKLTPPKIIQSTVVGENSKLNNVKSDKSIEEPETTERKSERDLRNLKRNDSIIDKSAKKTDSHDNDVKKKSNKLDSSEKVNKKSLVIEKLLTKSPNIEALKKLEFPVESIKKSNSLQLDPDSTENSPEKKTKRKVEVEPINNEKNLKAKCDKLIEHKEGKSDKNEPPQEKAATVASEKKLKRKIEVPQEKEVKTKSKAELPCSEEPKVAQRPTRKTKEAAAIYMEILGHKLVHDGEIDDDDTSIDSFPELPNVRKTEQREIEMKATVKSKTDYKHKESLNVVEKEKRIAKSEDKSAIIDHKQSTENKPISKQQIKKDLDKKNNANVTSNKDVIPESSSTTNSEVCKPEDKSFKNEIEKRTTRGSLHNKLIVLEGSSDSENDSVKIRVTKVIKQTKNTKITKENPELNTTKENHEPKTGKENSEAKTPKENLELKTPKENLELKTAKEPKEHPKPKTIKENSESKTKEHCGPKAKEHPEPKTKEQPKLKTANENPESKTTVLKNNLDNQKEKLVESTKTEKANNSESEKSVISQETTNKIVKRVKKLDKTPEKKLDNSFSDSDEEPLSKLAQTINKSNDKKFKNKRKSEEISDKEIKVNKNVKQMRKDTSEKIKQEEPILVVSGKPKRECTKRPQNYLPLFSSSEDEEQYFYGFVKTENVKSNKTTKIQNKCHSTPTADLLCKDVDKRFGKGKVNMSTEQIEKWLNDSAMAGNAIKKEDDELMKFIEKNLLDKLDEDILKEPATSANMIDKCSLMEHRRESKVSEVMNSATNAQLKLIDRKAIFSKVRKNALPSVNAFSANNESSVYAFEADTEDTVKTPFRRPTRRPSSTATTRSEDSSKCENPKSLKKVSTFSAIKPSTSKDTSKQEVSLTLSTDESHNSNSITIHLDSESKHVLKETRTVDSTDQNDTEDGEKVFYIPSQPRKQLSAQTVQGIAVKLGTKNTSVQNQHVIVNAKLVTHTPVGAQKLIEKPLATSTPMDPPSTTIQKSKISDNLKSSYKNNINHKMQDRMSENSEEFKYKIPSSPSASSSSSTKISKRTNVKPRMRSVEFCNPITTSDFPIEQKTPMLIEAPVFHPNEKEFQDPLEYIEKIRPFAEKFGICRIVPPSNFKPDCKVADDMRFTAYNQYVQKMLHRWGPNFKELMAISKYLKTQNIALVHPPWIGGMEIDLPRLYQIVQSLGGLKEVIEKKKWPKVSELMKIPKSAQDRVTKLDDIYCKYLLPYDTLSPAEREKLFDEVETDWAKRESRALLKSQQKVTTLDASLNSSDSESDDESEECIVKGRNMALNAFYRIARNTMSMWFKTMEPSAQEVEQEFWKHVTTKQNHICVHSGSIDCGNWGYGFAVSKNSPFARHAWNLKVLTNNSGSILRSLGPVMGVTVPTLHVGMVFSACCWYRDPHSLPWIEYLHTGGNKIWYGIPNSMSKIFHKALIKLVPNYCRNKALWLPSDTAMVPPSRLVENGVSLCRTIQEPGQFIVVFPKVFTSSICTGYVVSESVYFAPPYWLSAAQSIFDDLQESCEPSMFSFDKLVVKVASDVRSNVEVLRLIIPIIQLMHEKEKFAWQKLQKLNLVNQQRIPLPEIHVKKKKKLQNDSGDYECEVCSKNLYISWVTESEDLVYCLEHAIEYVESKKLEVENCILTYMYNNEELINLIVKAKTAIETKLQKKVTGKVAMNS